MTGRFISIRSAIFPERGLRTTAGFWLLLAAALIVSTPAVTGAVLLAAALHELGHLTLLLCFGVPVEGVQLGAFGAVIRAPGAVRLSYPRELAVSLGGPAVNLCAAPLLSALSARLRWEWGWLLAGANLLLGLYNLLPILPLDGARTLYLLTAWRFGPEAGRRTAILASQGAAAMLVLLGGYLTFTFGGTLFLLSALGLFFTALHASA